VRTASAAPGYAQAEVVMRPSAKRAIRWGASGALALVLGPVAAWGSAWAVAAWDQRKGGAFENAAKPETWTWVRKSPERDPFTSFVGLFMGAPGAKREEGKLGTRVVTYSPGAYNEVRVWLFGLPWPCVSMAETNTMTFTTGAPVRGTTANNAWRANLGAGVVLLPMRPSWGAFIADAAFWTAVFGGFLVGLPVLRFVTRAYRGACTECGYDCRGLAAGAPCPECGASRAATSPP